MSTGIEVITSGMPHWPTFAPAWAGDVEVERDGDAATFTFARSWSIPSTHRGTDDATLLIVRQRFEQPQADAEPIDGTPWVQAGESGLWADYRANEVAWLLRSIADALAPQSAAQAAQHPARDVEPERGAR